MKFHSLVAVVGLALAWLGVANAAPEKATLVFSGVFQDGAVLQREKPLPVWGWAPPGETVSVNFAGKSADAVAGTSGRWQVVFPPIPAGGPYELRATAGDRSVVCRDVLVGEVWLFSGQSNMGGPLGKVIGGLEAWKETDLPQVRIGLQYGAPSDGSTDRRLAPAVWVRASPRDPIDRWIAIHFAFGRRLYRELKVPIGLIAANRGGTRISTWVSVATHEREPAFQPALAAYREGQRLVAEGKAKAVPLHNAPGLLYDELIAPLAPFAIRGVLWYQGESDSPYAELYRRRFPIMIRDWRALWSDPSLPFIFAEIAYSNGKPWTSASADSPQAELRESQQAGLALPHTAMISTYDLVRPGDDVHYLDKLPVGERFAQAALAVAYGRQEKWHGPVFRGAERDGHALRVRFDDADGLQARGGAPGGFAIAGADRKWVWAEARIAGDTVLVSHPAVPEPVAVRYNWVGTPCGANLANAAGLPAEGFRSDDWPLTTTGKVEAPTAR